MIFLQSLSGRQCGLSRCLPRSKHSYGFFWMVDFRCGTNLWDWIFWQLNQTFALFFDDSEGDIKHLFGHYRRINPIWYKVVGLWDISLVCPQNIPRLFDYWFHTALTPRNILAWWVAFFAMMWSIWTVCNHIIFHQKAFDEYAWLELFWYQFAW